MLGMPQNLALPRAQELNGQTLGRADQTAVTAGLFAADVDEVILGPVIAAVAGPEALDHGLLVQSRLGRNLGLVRTHGRQLAETRGRLWDQRAGNV